MNHASEISQPTEDPNDPFDTLLTLEDTLYTSAYAQGIRDGARAGRIEGRIFGLEKGFEKFASLGVLHGRASVWGARLPKASSSSTSPGVKEQPTDGESETARNLQIEDQDDTIKPVLPLIESPNTRLHRNVHLLYHLTDPLTFDTSNTEDAVADFDDRFKRASAKAKIIERSIGEHIIPTEDGGGDDSPKKGLKRPVRMTKEGGGRGRDADNMEDFAGSRLLR
ncbi:uncharacterized protein EI97DRAFT_385122 [Westerdykella ornata]|uniref:Essential protein Yae1 N-terminal domain-containing protein n=1 Tax=Westerdykella ornata TaxID=318751 RepID=A0A6A6J967_WESOR|nr:uncharacterized protein EI97DRAFT_385122 [Westerdykella ornata]KAF2272723.1 hypothetical protein EI97DRAFT_385122 [Westerdykella ornata]